MASLKNIIAGASALIALAHAAPVVDVTVTNTVTQTHWTTVDCVKTIWLPADQSPLSTTSSSSTTSTQGPSYTSIRTTLYTTTLYTTTVPAPTTTTSVYVAPTTTYVPPAPATTTSAYTPPAPVTTESPAYVAPTTTTTTTTTYQAPATSSPAATSAVVADTQPGSFVEASASNGCTGPSDACSGDVTHWDGGLGACGWDVASDSDMAVALPVGFMGSQSNGNPYCGRSLTIRNPTTGTTVQAKVGDKCMGCQGRAIDLTNALFKAVTDGTGDGRESGFQWWLN